jgi:sulfate adenylyltransferase
MFSKLVPPHGGRGLVCALLAGSEREAELARAKTLKQIEVSDRAKGDLIMMGIGGFSPLDGFMTRADWKGVCENFQMADGTFWPVPITLDVAADIASGIKEGDEIALVNKG